MKTIIITICGVFQETCQMQHRLRRALQMSENKTILDVCCGGRMWWHDKHDPRGRRLKA